LERESRVASGAYQPGGHGTEWDDLDVLRRLRRRSLAVLRREVEAVDGDRLGLFLPAWQGIGNTSPGAIRLPEVVRALQGRPVPASILESDVLTSRMNYNPSDLDLLLASGEVVWIGHGSLGTADGKVALYFRDHVPLLHLDETPAEPPGDAIHDAIRSHLAARGASFFNDLFVAAGGGDPHLAIEALWDLVWNGEVTNDTLSPLRAFVGARRRTGSRRPNLRLSVPPAGSGRWYLVNDLLTDAPGPAPEQQAKALAEQLLERHGVVTRPAVLAEGVPGGFAGLYPVFAAMEDAGKVRRGYFVEGLGGAQFGLPGAIDRLRDSTDSGVIVMASADPANPFGSALPWPQHDSGSPSKRAGAYVILCNGELAAYVERGARSVLTWVENEPAIVAGVLEVAKRRRGTTTVATIDGLSALSSPMGAALLDAGFVTGYKGVTYRNR
jgi:ATP-dependent Lhr-like helicase